jgi:hypothetical protein
LKSRQIPLMFCGSIAEELASLPTFDEKHQ